MTALLANAAWPACISALRLDRWMAGELGPEEAGEVKAHVDGCPRCADAVETLRPERAAPLPPLRMVAVAAPGGARSARRFRVPWALAAGLAAAAGVVLLLRPGPVERTKGGGVGLGMYVLHAGAVRQAAPDEVAAPGDAVRFAVTTPERAYVAVLSVDPAGRASIYFPAGGRAEAVGPGADVPLPLATRLDATLGEERVLGLFCDRPVELEPVRSSLEKGGGAIPEGCQVTRWSFVKR